MDKEKNPLIPEVKLSDYDYYLPKSKIADYPAPKRDESKLLYFNKSEELLSKYKFSDISSILNRDFLLTNNTTKVIAARLYMNKPTGGKAELLCIEPLEPSKDPQITMMTPKEVIWEAIIGGRKIEEAMVLEPAMKIDGLEFSAQILEKKNNKVKVKFQWKPQSLSFAEIINKIGKIPLPPYIKRDTEEIDSERYQTVYAKQHGSIAAPTAGLHFTEDILSELQAKGIKRTELILHVGPGTFQPVEEEDARNHEMHSEQIFVSRESIEDLIDASRANKKIIATGTTSMRTLESLYIFGNKLRAGIKFVNGKLDVKQWDGFLFSPANSDRFASLVEIRKFMDSHNMDILNGETTLFIVPGYNFGLTDGLITNFHLPKSTLLMLVAAFIGKDNMERIYKYALDNNFRFLSYGDSSLLLR